MSNYSFRLWYNRYMDTKESQSNSLAENTEQPIEQPVAQPVDHPVAQPVDQPVDQPIAQEANQADDEIIVANPIMEAGSGIKRKKQITIPEPLKKFFSSKKNIAIVVASLFVVVAAAVILTTILNKEESVKETKKTETGKTGTDEKKVTKYYDNLTGELVAYSGTQYNSDGTEKENENGKVLVYTEMQAEQFAVRNNQKRINCVQISNDARPQVGLSEARIVYETPAENGAVRFSAIFRGATSNMIGPISTLRHYNHNIDKPYDCTFVFSNGDNVVSNNVKRFANFSEANGNMWRDGSTYVDPNNIFTSAEKLNAFNRDEKIERSDPSTMSRMAPEDSVAELKAIRKAQSEGDTSTYKYVSNIYVHMSNMAQYNVNYVYNANTNSYSRAYETGEPHVSYMCKNLKISDGAISPSKDCGQAVQLSPKVVVVLKMEEDRKYISGNNGIYTNAITTTGSGEAWVFQNGIMINGTWERSHEKQFVLKDTDGEEIKLAPGQTFVSIFSEANGYIRF